MAALLTGSFLSVFIPFLLFKIQTRRGAVQVKLDNEQQNNRKLLQKISMSIEPLIAPPFGFLHYRFLYDAKDLSPKFSLAKTGLQTKLFQNAQQGFYQWPLPAIRAYDVDKLVVYFEDIFQFFSLSTTVPVNQSFYTKPTGMAAGEQQIAPQKTDTETIRIEELRRVEGELLHYKNFENNDDVRRIVWKIYAKNKELVVRIPEIFDPFASHIYFYCSFFDSIGIADMPTLQTRGLNWFKNACWGMYEQIKKQGGEVKFIADQDIPTNHFTDTGKGVEYSLAVSKWQQHNPLNNYVKAKDASVVCVHSLTEVGALSQLLSQTGTGLTIVLVKLNHGMAKTNVMNWLRWIFLQEEKDDDKTNTLKWKWSSARRKLVANEKKLEALVKGSEAKLIVL